MKIEISATQRKVQGTGASRRLRRSGRVPGIVYGGDRDAVNIEFDHKELYRNLTNEKFHASILTLKLDSGVEQVLLRKDVMGVRRLATSLMPSFAEGLKPSEIADLLAWLHNNLRTAAPAPALTLPK